MGKEARQPQHTPYGPRSPAVIGHAPRNQSCLCVALLIGLCAALLVPVTWGLPLADLDESRAAIITRQMLDSGDWLIPHKSGRPWADKPAPYYWLTAAGTALTGDLELGGRIVSAVFATLGVLAAFALGRRVAGVRAGLLAGLVLLSSAAFFFVARIYRMDMPFVALMWLALWWFWRYEPHGATDAAARLKRWLGFYGFCAGATLMKGPAGLVLPGLVVGAYLLLSGRSRRVFEMVSLPGIALFLLIAGPWYLAASLRRPELAYEFFFVHNVARYAGSAMEDKTFPAVYYVLVILGGMMPWTIYLPGAVVREFPRRWAARMRRPARLFCWLAVLIPLAFFMAGKTRLEIYVLPVAWPLAILIALPLASWMGSLRRDRLYHIGTLAMRWAVFAMVPVLGVYEWRKGWLDAWILLAAGIIAALMLAATAAVRANRRGAYLGWVTSGIAVVLLFSVFHTGPRAFAMRSCYRLGLAVRPELTADSTLCYLGPRQYSFPLYAGRTQAKRFLPDRKEDREHLVRLMRSSKPVFCLVDGEQALKNIEEILREDLTVIARNEDFAAVTNRAAVEPNIRQGRIAKLRSRKDRAAGWPRSKDYSSSGTQ